MWEDENPSLNFYYFTNYNQGPELEIYTLPMEVFNFLVDIPLEDKHNWNFILKKDINLLNGIKKKLLTRIKKLLLQKTNQMLFITIYY